jgi:hypothetical protein
MSIINMPGAWYDLAGRISALQAISSCALEAIPGGLNAEKQQSANHAASLVAAMQDILGLMQQDANLIETQLKL